MGEVPPNAANLQYIRILYTYAQLLEDVSMTLPRRGEYMGAAR